MWLPGDQCQFVSGELYSILEDSVKCLVSCIKKKTFFFGKIVVLRITLIFNPFKPVLSQRKGALLRSFFYLFSERVVI